MQRLSGALIEALAAYGTVAKITLPTTKTGRITVFTQGVYVYLSEESGNPPVPDSLTAPFWETS